MVKVYLPYSMSMTSVSLASIIKLSVPMELSFLIFTFLKARHENKVKVKVTGSRRLENGLVVPGAFLARTTSRAIEGERLFERRRLLEGGR